MATNPSTQPQQQPDDPFAGLVAQQQAPAQQASQDDPFASIAQSVQPSGPAPDSAISRLVSGVWNSTLGPIVSLGKDLKSYYDQKSAAESAIDAAGGPATMLADAVSDPNHPLHKLGAGIVSSAWDQVKQAAHAGASAVDAERAGLSALMRGDTNAATEAAQQVGQNASEAAGHALAAQLPGIGPAAADAGKKIGEGDTAGGIGEGAGLIGATLLGGKLADGGEEVASAKPSNLKALVSEDAAAAKAQPAVQGAVREAAEDTAAAEGVTPKPAPSVRDAVQNVGDSVLERSKAAYNQLDEVSGGRWQRFDDQLKNLRDKMDEVSGIDDDAYSKFEQRARDVEAAQNDLVSQLVADGKIDPDLAESAKGDYKQANALFDLSQQIRGSASGLRPEIGEGTPETIDPAKLSPRLNKLYDSGRLQQALGEDGAQALVKQVDDALRTKASAVKTAKLVKTIAKYGAGVVGIGGAYEGVKNILGGSH